MSYSQHNLQSQGGTQGGTSAGTESIGCPTLDNSLKSKELQHNEHWLSVKDVSHLLQIDIRSVKRHCKQGVYQTTKVHGNGGQQYRILLSSLPKSAQIAYFEQNNPEPADNPSEDEPDIQWDIKVYTESPLYNRKLADKYNLALEFCEGCIGNDLKKRIEEWNTANPDMTTSYPRILAARKAKKAAGVQGILGNYGKTRGRAFSIEELDGIGDVAYRRFKGLYLNDSRRATEDCWHAARGRALELQRQLDPSKVDELYSRFPHASTFMRLLEKKLSKSSIYFARYGEEAWNRKFGAHIDRDDSNVRAGEIWESDHHQIDNLWIATAEGLSDTDAAYIKAAVREMRTELKGQHIRPWLTVWRDYKTGIILSWLISFDAPNAERVLNCFADAVDKYGVPEEIRIDNGKDYRAYDVAGGRRKIEINERSTRSIMAILGVKATFVWTYHGQSKRVERGFRSFAHQLAKLVEGYVGMNTVERPESLRKTTQKGALVTFVHGCRALDTYIHTINHRMPSRGKTINGRCRIQAWEDEFDGLPRLDADSLGLLRMRSTKTVAIRGDGIHYKGMTFYAPWMEQYKGSIKVYLRLPSDPSAQEAWVFRADTDELLGRAGFNPLVAPGTTRTDAEREQLSNAIALKRQVERHVRATSRPEEIPDLDEVRADIATSIQHGQIFERGVLMHLSDPAAVGRTLMSEVIDTATGEVWEAGETLTAETILSLIHAGYSQVRVERSESKITKMTRYDKAGERLDELRATGTYALHPEPKPKPEPEIHFFPKI